MSLSYRHVWGELKRWESELGQELIVWEKGQSARLSDFGTKLMWAERQTQARLAPQIEALRADLQRVVQMWQTELARSGGPMLFGSFSIADAFFAPVCMRLRSYALPVPADVQAYVDRVAALPSVARWVDEASAEKDFLPFEEPYRQAPA